MWLVVLLQVSPDDLPSLDADSEETGTYLPETEEFFGKPLTDDTVSSNISSKFQRCFSF